MFPEHAVKALEGADGAIFQGRLIHILPALPAIESTTTATSTTDATTGSTSSYKLAKEATLKKAANKEESWNSFFVPAASVLTAMAKALGVSKADIITDTHSEDGAKNKMHAAVRMALSETQVIAETKTWLAAQGVNLAAFDDSKTKERSNTALLLKNFPFDSTEEELRRLVTKFGTVTRFLLPPNHTLAMCEFAHSQEARQAFRGLAFKRFKSAPLYMEWAPQAAFNPIVVTEPAAETKADEPSTDGLLATDNGNADSLSLFVKNLNFDTTEEKLKSTFEQIGAVRSATIAKKKNTKTSGKDKDKAFLSMGFGFVEFVSTAHAHDALRKLQNVEVDGHRLQLKLSQRGESAPTTETATGKRKTAAPEVSLAPSTKILVKNLAFEAGPKDLRQLFSTFGQVKSVRMPKKFDGTHRGFGFVELVTKQEALNAYKALADTHLYGRHLVMQWANADDGVDELRQKSALQAEIERNDGFNVNAASKKRKTAVTIDSNDKSFAAAFGASME
jgi:multiple RNA-binding domain-containing protein 1